MTRRVATLPSMTIPSPRFLFLFIVLFVAGGVSVPFAQQDGKPGEIDESLNELLEGALEIRITARIIDEDENVEVWNMHVTRVTIGGRSVSVQMEGSNLRVFAEFTPYWENDQELLIVAQGQTWIEHGTGTTPQYRTAFNTLPVRLGEPIIFLPPRGNDTYRLTRIDTEGSILSLRSTWSGISPEFETTFIYSTHRDNPRSPCRRGICVMVRSASAGRSICRSRFGGSRCSRHRCGTRFP